MRRRRMIQYNCSRIKKSEDKATCSADKLQLVFWCCEAKVEAVGVVDLVGERVVRVSVRAGNSQIMILSMHGTAELAWSLPGTRILHLVTASEVIPSGSSILTACTSVALTMLDLVCHSGSTTAPRPCSATWCSTPGPTPPARAPRRGEA